MKRYALSDLTSNTIHEVDFSNQLENDDLLDPPKLKGFVPLVLYFSKILKTKMFSAKSSHPSLKLHHEKLHLTDCTSMIKHLMQAIKPLFFMVTQYKFMLLILNFGVLPSST